MRRFFTWLQRKGWLERYPLLAIALIIGGAALPGLSGYLLEGPIAVATVVPTIVILPLLCFYCWHRDANPLPRPALELPKHDGSDIYLSVSEAEQVFALLEREVLLKGEVAEERELFLSMSPYGIGTYPFFATCRRHVYPAHLYAAGGRLWFEIYRRDKETVALCSRVNAELAQMFQAPPKPGPRSRLSIFAARTCSQKSPSI